MTSLDRSTATRRRRSRLGASIVALVLCAGCTTTTASPSAAAAADLVPVPMTGVEGFLAYCDLVDGGLRLTIQNVGSGDAGPSLARVAFDYSARLGTAEVPAIAAGASVQVRVVLPTPLPEIAYDFTITIDAGDVVPESDESNNFGEGRCEP